MACFNQSALAASLWASQQCTAKGRQVAYNTGRAKSVQASEGCPSKHSLRGRHPDSGVAEPASVRESHAGRPRCPAKHCWPGDSQVSAAVTALHLRLLALTVRLGQKAAMAAPPGQLRCAPALWLCKGDAPGPMANEDEENTTCHPSLSTSPCAGRRSSPSAQPPELQTRTTPAISVGSDPTRC